MSATSSSSTVRRGLPRTVIAFVLLAAAVLIWAGYSVHWSWTGLSDNDTLWDWMKLLVLPLSLAAVPLWLQSHQKMSWTRRGTLVVGATAFSTFVPLGYLLHWKWTGFAGNTLWDWLELLLLPIVIATVKFWTAERTIQARHRIAAAAVVMGVRGLHRLRLPAADHLVRVCRQHVVGLGQTPVHSDPHAAGARARGDRVDQCRCR